MTESKVCNTCSVEKHVSNFYVKRKKPNITYRSDCKLCYGIKSAKHFMKPEISEARKRAYRKYKRFNLYGITEEVYKDMVEEQDSRCLICKVVNTNLYIDHCHTSGLVRGLLCSTCNSGLGMYKDDISLLESAIGYLRSRSGG